MSEFIHSQIQDELCATYSTLIIEFVDFLATNNVIKSNKQTNSLIKKYMESKSLFFQPSEIDNKEVPERYIIKNKYNKKNIKTFKDTKQKISKTLLERAEYNHIISDSDDESDSDIYIKRNINTTDQENNITECITNTDRTYKNIKILEKRLCCLNNIHLLNLFNLDKIYIDNLTGFLFEEIDGIYNNIGYIDTVKQTITKF